MREVESRLISDYIKSVSDEINHNNCQLMIIYDVPSDPGDHAVEHAPHGPRPGADRRLRHPRPPGTLLLLRVCHTKVQISCSYDLHVVHL